MTTIYTQSLFTYAVLIAIAIASIGGFVGSLFDYFLCNSMYVPKIKWNLVIVGVAMLVCLFCGYTFGKQSTINKAELVETTQEGYIIMYGDESEVHEYTYK